MKTEIFWIVITTRSTQALTIEQLRMIGTSTLLTFATTLMTQGFKAAWVELVALRTATGAMAFPIAGAIIAITAITVAIGYLVFKKKELTESEKRQLELQKSIQADFFKEKANLTVLIDQLKDVNISQTARKRLIGEINEQYGEYLPKLLTEKTTTEELTGAYNLLIEALARKISTQKLTESGADILNRIDLNKEEIDAQTKSLEAFKERHKAELEIAKYNPRAYGVELSSMFQMEKNLKDLKNKGVELQNEYGTILNKLSNLTPKKGFNIKGGGLTSTEDDTETFKNRQAERESNFKKEEVQIKEQYANKVGMQDELNEKLRKSNLNFVNESIADYEKANRTEGENAAAYWALREKRADLMLSSEKGTTKAIKEENKERIKDAKEFEQELIDIEKLRIETITNEREKSIATENERHLQSMAKNWKNDQALEYEEVIHQQNLTEFNQKFLDKQLADKTLNYTQKEVLLEEYWKQELITEETYWILKSQLNKDKQLALEEFKKQYGLLSMQQTIDMEIAELKRGAFYYLLTEEEKERAIDSIRLKYGRKRAQTLKRNIDKELNDIKEKFTEEQQLAYENGTKQITIYENMGDRITNVFSEMFAENQNAMAVFGKEMLLIALDFIKAEIRLQYPLILAKQIASKGVIAGPIAAGTSIALIEAAMAVGFGLAKGLIGSINTSKKTKQAADGIYPVIGGNDGQLYNAYYGGQAQTGIYGKPTLLEMSGGRTLVGERAPELVVDGNTFRRMQINAPGLLNDIYAFAGKGSGSASRLERQMAEGNYPLNRSMEGAITIGSDPELKAINRALAEELKYLRENGIKAKVAGYGGEGSVADAIQKIAALAKSLKL